MIYYIFIYLFVFFKLCSVNKEDWSVDGIDTKDRNRFIYLVVTFHFMELRFIQWVNDE